jgi:Phospholipid methyltransferase
MAPAYCLWALARLQLGTSFAIRPQAKELVTRGFYAKIQNPEYVFNAIFYAGLFVFFGRLAWFSFFLVLIPLPLVRIREERSALEAKFGDAYREYRKRQCFGRTKSIPWVIKPGTDRRLPTWQSARKCQINRVRRRTLRARRVSGLTISPSDNQKKL